MLKKSPGNILLTFILVVVLCTIVVAFISLMPPRLRDIAWRENYSKSLYIAEAGMHKAIWYLVTDVGEGGKGSSWRTGGLTEAFGGGNYTIKVEDTVPDEVKITSTGNLGGVSRSMEQRMRLRKLPGAFDYAMFSASWTRIRGNTTISGDVYSEGNVTISSPARVINGVVYTGPGSSVSGDGDYTDGGNPSPLPTLPVLDTTYYDGLISQAQAQPSGDQTLENYDLGGATLLVNGKVTLKGNITGGGTIVATKNILVGSGGVGATISGDTTLIAEGTLLGGGIKVHGASNIQEGLLYSPSRISLIREGADDPRVTGTIMADGAIIMVGEPTIRGIVFTPSMDLILGSPTILGSMVHRWGISIPANLYIEYDPAYLPPPPPGLIQEGLFFVPGSWKEL